MKSEQFRDLHLLQELAKNPNITQRDLGKRMGLALGLVNLRLHHLSTQNLIEIVETGKNRIRYVLTPKGIQERDRWMAEYLDQSMRNYHDARRFLTESTDVVILCGGKGTRLKSLTAVTPKPLLRVGNEPFLLRLIGRLQQEGFRRFILAAHYLPEQFELFMEEHRVRLKGVQLVLEPEPLGTGGALRHAAGHVASSHFIALNGDTWIQQPMAPVLEEHMKAEWEFSVVAVPVRRVEGEALKKGVWKIGPAGELLGLETQEAVSDGWVNAGCYLLSRSLAASWPEGPYSLEENLTSLLAGHKIGVHRSDGRMLDIGTPELYGRAAELLESYECEETSLK